MEELVEQLEKQEARYRQLATWVVETARDMEHLGRPPSAEILRDLQHIRSRFNEFRDQVYDQAEAERLEPLPAREHVTALSELRELLARVEEARNRNVRLRERIAAAQEVLESVLALKASEEPVEAKLAAVRGRAGEYLERLVGLADQKEPDGRLLVEVEDMAEGHHPLAMLVVLASGHRDLADERWQKLTQEVTTALGSVVAIAAARGRVELRRAEILR